MRWNDQTMAIFGEPIHMVDKDKGKSRSMEKFHHAAENVVSNYYLIV